MVMLWIKIRNVLLRPPAPHGGKAMDSRFSQAIALEANRYADLAAMIGKMTN